MTSTVLRGIAASWLRYERECHLITFERGVGHGRPDLLGVDKRRDLIEVEIKVSVADFKRDQKKRKHLFRKHGWTTYVPAFFYYVVPDELVEKVLPLLPEGAGLLAPLKGWKVNPKRMNPYNGLPDLHSVKPAVRDHEAKRMNAKAMIAMVRDQSGTLCSLAAAAARAEMAAVGAPSAEAA